MAHDSADHASREAARAWAFAARAYYSANRFRSRHRSRLLRSGSALEGNAEKVALAPDQSAHANGPEIVEGQREVERHDL